MLKIDEINGKYYASRQWMKKDRDRNLHTENFYLRAHQNSEMGSMDN